MALHRSTPSTLGTPRYYLHDTVCALHARDQAAQQREALAAMQQEVATLRRALVCTHRAAVSCAPAAAAACGCKCAGRCSRTVRTVLQLF